MQPSTHTILLMAGTLTLSARFVVLTAAFVLTAVAHSQPIWYVDDDNCPGPGSGTLADPFCSIQTAILAAVDTDEIVVAPGTYFETINFNGKAIWLHSSDGADVTTIDGTGNFHVVQCVNVEGPDTLLDGFTITGGNANGVFPGNVGGGMYNASDSNPTVTDCTFSGNTANNGGGMANLGGNPTVTNCTFEGNTAGFGGGMSNSNSSPTVTNCSFSGNTAEPFGGGMYNTTNSNPTVTNCTFSGNSAVNGSAGGMYNAFDSNPTVTDCTFSGNTASDGGAGGMGNLFNSSPTVTNCTFSGNTAGFGGGGMSNNNSSPTVTDCTFSENTVTFFAGGMFNGDSSPTVTNCTFSGNSAGFRGGGMFNFGGSATVTDCTFSENLAANEGGGMFDFNGSSPTVINCTFSGNSAANGNALGFDSGPSNMTMNNCILWDSGDEIWNNDGSVLTITYTIVQGGFPGTGNIDADPLFIDPLNGDYRLSPGSPCIDAANNTAVPAGITTDLDGNPRFHDDLGTPDTGNPDGINPIIDMGAFEFQGSTPPPPCPWDCDSVESVDGIVGIVDVLTLLAQWGGPGSCDFDGGGVDNTDFIELLANWGPCP